MQIKPVALVTGANAGIGIGLMLVISFKERDMINGNSR